MGKEPMMRDYDDDDDDDDDDNSTNISTVRYETSHSVYFSHHKFHGSKF
jgi:hypothetical protein